VAELLQHQPAVIVTVGGVDPTRAAIAATNTVPIVFEVGADPVSTGLVASLGPPGGNATGVNLMTADLNAKRVELLHQMVPRAGTIAALINPGAAAARAIEVEVRTAAAAQGVKPWPLFARSETQIDAAFATIAERRITALVVTNDPFLNSRREQLLALVTRDKLPAIFEWREFALAGGLMSYGSDLSWPCANGACMPGACCAARSRRTCRAAAAALRAGDQPQDRQGAGPDDPASAAAARRRGDRVMRRRRSLWAIAAGALAVPMALRAQPAPKLRIGWLSVTQRGVFFPGLLAGAARARLHHAGHRHRGALRRGRKTAGDGGSSRPDSSCC